MLRPFFTYYGGKYRAAPHYPAPAHDVLIEPFAGSAGYALRHPGRRVILVERDPIIASVWAYLLRVSAAEIRALPLAFETVDDLSVSDEAKALIGFWLNKGAAQPCKRPSKWMRQGIAPNSWWGEAIRERIASQLSFIRHWRVICSSYDQAPDVAATWFVDPPYMCAGTHYRFGAQSVDYAHLGAWCRARQGQVIVCENSGADWLPFVPFRVIKSTPGKYGKSYSTEVVWTNERVRRARHIV